MLSDGQEPEQRKAALALAGIGLLLILTAVWLVISRLPTEQSGVRPVIVAHDRTQVAGWYLALTVSLLTVVLFCAVLIFWRWGRRLKECHSHHISEPSVGLTPDHSPTETSDQSSKNST